MRRLMKKLRTSNDWNADLLFVSFLMIFGSEASLHGLRARVVYLC